MPPAVALNNVTKCYGSTVAVNNLSLEVERGEIVGLLGPNGAGKSTTLRMMTGLVRPTSGSVSVLGKDPRRKFVEIAERVGILFERPTFFDYLNVEKNLEIAARLCGQVVSLDRALDRVGILSLAHQRVGTLSAGLRQRLAISMALLTEPELLILDEPTSALDPEYVQETISLLRQLAHEGDVAVVLTSHIMSEVEVLCDRVAILNHGKLLSLDHTDTLLSYDRSVIEVLIDAPEAAARRLENETWIESVELRTGKIIVRLRDENPHQLNAFLIGAGYQLHGLIPQRRTLHEYFLKAINQ